MYFTHSYSAPIVNATAASCEYGGEFSAAVEQDNLFGVQFHPEKSGRLGSEGSGEFLRSAMLTKRIIACLDVNAGRVVKGVQFEQLRDAGDPAELASAHSAQEPTRWCCSISLLRAKTAQPSADTVRRTAEQLFVPFTVGGGIRSLEDAIAVFEAGADKVSINSAALADSSLITRIAERYGSQAVIVAIDAKRINGAARFEAYVNGGRNPTGRDAVTWALEAEDRGAGEILLTSMDRDGTGAGLIAT